MLCVDVAAVNCRDQLRPLSVVRMMMPFAPVPELGDAAA